MDPDSSGLFASITFSPAIAGGAISLLIACVLLIISGFACALKSSLTYLRPLDLEEIEEEEEKADPVIRQLLNNFEQLAISVSLFRNLLLVSVIVLSVYGLRQILFISATTAILLPALLLFILILLISEVVPRILAQQFPLRLARMLAKPFRTISNICKPISAAIIRLSPQPDSKRKKHHLSVDELTKALELTSGEIKEDKEILEGIIKFHDKTSVQIMTSRIDISALDIQSSFKEVIEHIVESGYSRIPIYSESIDTIKGLLYIKDLLPYIDQADNFRWQKLIRPAYFVPETKKIDDLLEEFRTNKVHLSIVVDEFGATSGIVTLEDILEEIVGEISDEYDDEDSRYSQLADGAYIFEAKTQLADFFKITGINPDEFEQFTGDAETLAGLILEIKGSFPEQGEEINFLQYSFQILEINQRRILKVKVMIGEPVEETGKSKE